MEEEKQQEKQEQEEKQQEEKQEEKQEKQAEKKKEAKKTKPAEESADLSVELKNLKFQMKELLKESEKIKIEAEKIKKEKIETEIKLTLSEKIRNEYYGADEKIDNLILKGLIDKKGNKIIFKDENDKELEIDFDKGLKIYSEKWANDKKNTQATGSGSMIGSVNTSKTLTDAELTQLMRSKRRWKI